MRQVGKQSTTVGKGKKKSVKKGKDKAERNKKDVQNT
jgi:hypothetical protein